MDITPMIITIFGIDVGLVFFAILIISGIFLLRKRKILKPDKRKLFIFLLFFLFLSSIPILWVSFMHSSSLLDIAREEISEYFRYSGIYHDTIILPERDFLNKFCLIIFTPLLLIIAYLSSCGIVSIHDKFKTKK